MPNIVDLRSRLEALPASVLSDAEQRWRAQLLKRIDERRLITAREWRMVEAQVNEMRSRPLPVTKPELALPQFERSRSGIGGKSSQHLTGDVTDDEGRPRPAPRSVGSRRPGRALRSGT